MYTCINKLYVMLCIENYKVISECYIVYLYTLNNILFTYMINIVYNTIYLPTGCCIYVY